MLGFIVRAVFLLGVLTWYSTGVWKMIDGYFREQFRHYLEEEYRKNPRMRAEVQDSVDKIESSISTSSGEATVEQSREILEANETSTVEGVENGTQHRSSEPSHVTGGTSENEAAWGFTDKNAFLQLAMESELESRKSSEAEQDSRRSINHEDRDLERGDHDDRFVSRESKRTQKKIKYDKRPARDFSSETRETVKMIKLTDRDFKSTRNRVPDDDFWEFEEDAAERKPIEGVLVSELPFKPRADIGDLEIVTRDEYCPLNLEEESSCEDTFEWP